MYFNGLTSKLTVLLILFASLLQGCAGPKHGRYHSGTVPATAQSVEYGTIVRVGEGFIPKDNGFLGSGDVLTMATGIAVGGYIGGMIAPAATVAGLATGGLVAGQSLDESEDREIKGIELTIETDAGQYVTLVQENDDYFAENDRVRVIYNADGSARAVH